MISCPVFRTTAGRNRGEKDPGGEEGEKVNDEIGGEMGVDNREIDGEEDYLTE